MNVLVTKNFEKDFKNLPKNIQKKVKDFWQKMQQLEDLKDFKSNNLIELATSNDISYYRYRIGNYRLGFSKIYDNKDFYLSFQVIKSRGEIYKYFPPSNKKRKK